MKRTINFLFVLCFFLSAVFAQSSEVLTGIEVLKENNFRQLQGLKIGLITNQTGVDNSFNSTIDLLHKTKNVELVALFGPEHGVRGDIDAGKKIKSFTDQKTGLPVYSLYGSNKKPSAKMLKNIDALVYDIQDIGCRSYTYISTMGLAMEAAAENGIKFFVLDRPNPLGGNRIEGNLPEEKYMSFISRYKIPYIYGLTCGELALLINDEGWLEKNLKCDLSVIKMKSWSRNTNITNYQNLWIPTSPHIPHKETSYYYPATGILGELRSLFNIGVGYTLPFEMILSEQIDALQLAEKLNKKFNTNDVVFRPTFVKPYYSGFKGKQLTGIQIYIKNFKMENLMWIQFSVLEEILKQRPELTKKIAINSNESKMFDKAIGTNKIREFIIQNRFDKIKSYLQKDIEQFRKLSEKYFLY
ncbi:MAG: exo-beta-N-acetylmuramidase NamZ domain-containing protein [Rhodothermaceae bacterium]